MLTQELIKLVLFIQQRKSKSQTIEVKTAEKNIPGRLYNTLSSFSNQDDGGIILLGLDEETFAVTGIADIQELQKRVIEQCEQMEPKIKPLFTTALFNGKVVVSAEIPECDPFERPCFYAGTSRVKGSYVREGMEDRLMTAYEVYSHETFRKKIQDELRTDPRAEMDQLNQEKLSLYFAKFREDKPTLSGVPESKLMPLLGIVANGKPTVAGILQFGIYPQALFPQYCILASVVPGIELGQTGEKGIQFFDDKRINGPLLQMLEDAVAFVVRNMKRRAAADDQGRRIDKAEYPIGVVRQAILNALIHRDYSIYTENAPIRLIMFDDRLVIESPGGLYGRGTLSQLGKATLDVRNPYILGGVETFAQSASRYSGIPAMRRQMQEHGLRPPVFENNQDVFRVILYNRIASEDKDNIEQRLLDFCEEPKTRGELAKEFGFTAPTYFLNTYVKPLVEEGRLAMSLPQTPKSKKQQYYTVGILKTQTNIDEKEIMK